LTKVNKKFTLSFFPHFFPFLHSQKKNPISFFFFLSHTYSQKNNHLPPLILHSHPVNPKPTYSSYNPFPFMNLLSHNLEPLTTTLHELFHLPYRFTFTPSQLTQIHILLLCFFTPPLSIPSEHHHPYWNHTVG